MAFLLTMLDNRCKDREPYGRLLIGLSDGTEA